MKLNVGERTALTRILPVKDEFLIMDILHPLKKRLFLTKDEVEEFEVKHNRESNMLVWNDAGRDNPVEIEMTGEQLGIIRTLLTSLNKTGDIEDEFISLYKKVMQNAD